MFICFVHLMIDYVCRIMEHVRRQDSVISKKRLVSFIVTVGARNYF